MKNDKRIDWERVAAESGTNSDEAQRFQNGHNAESGNTKDVKNAKTARYAITVHSKGKSWLRTVGNGSPSIIFAGTGIIRTDSSDNKETETT
jgi:hypothetical protein